MITNINIKKINKNEKKLNQFLNNTSKKQVVARELEITTDNADSEESNKQVLL